MLIEPIILFGDCMKVITGAFNVISVMPPWNMPRRYDGSTRSYPDKQNEEDYQEQLLMKLDFFTEHLTPSGLIVLHHRNRVVRGKLWLPEMLLVRLKTATIWDQVIILKGSTPNSNQGRSYPMHEKLYLLHRKGDDPNKIYSNPKADAYLDECGDSRSDTWYFPTALVKWAGSTHDAVSPVLLPYRIFYRWCPPGGAVCDPLLGSGTSAIAAMMLNLKFTGAEIMPRYYREILARVEEHKQSTQYKRIT